MIELHQGDCLELMKSIPDASVDMVLCDLPYGTTKCAWDTVLPYDDLWGEYSRICTGSIVLTASQPFTSMLVSSNPTGFRHSWVWNKAKAANFPQVKRAPLKVHEDVLVFGKHRYNPQMRTGVNRQKGGYQTKGEVSVSGGTPAVRNDQYYPKSILDFSTAGNRDAGLHPTQKPLALMEYLIHTYTNPGETVLDNCMGSGSTGVACVNTSRNFIGMEFDPGYFEIARNRIESAQSTMI